MSNESSPVVELTLARPKTIQDIQKWAAIAELIGVPSTSTVSLVGHIPSITVSAYLAQVPYPELEESE